MINVIKKFDDKEKWKQINFRSVETALGIEFLHDLYNRHLPNVNSLRFRNTILYCKGKKITSFAPVSEWDFLAKWFGERFIRGDKELWSNIEDYIKYPKLRLIKLLRKIKSINLKSLSKIELGLLLIDFHYTVLSEIYGINLVQIEHALNYAIDKLCAKYFKNPVKRKNIISTLLFTKEPTIGVTERNEFYEILIDGLSNNISYIKLSDKNFVLYRIKKHFKKYRYIHAAYGAKPYELSYYIKRYNDLAKQGVKQIKQFIENEKKSTKELLKIKKSYINKIKNDKILLKNIELMCTIGTLRDRNKALLGTLIEWREKILNEVSSRTGVPRDKLNWYFLAEICNLLSDGKILPNSLINARKKGLIVYRKEYVSTNLKEVENILFTDRYDVLNGICASPGKVSGKIKIIKSSSDIHKMSPGDIMVSPGTDFDLINAMQIAGAIITEEGGILSHASVVSRELGIPCIIGVTNATKILKDNSFVTINASKGEINVIGDDE